MSALASRLKPPFGARATSSASDWLVPGCLVLVVALAFFVRLQFVGVYGGHGGYLAWAKTHYFGGLSPAYLGGLKAATTMYPPGYPLFLGLLKWLGIADPQGMRIVQTGIDALATLPLFYLFRAARLSRPLAFLGIVIFASYPLFAVGSTFILAESLSPALLIGCLFLLVGAARNGSILRWGAAGLAAGAAAMFRPDFLLFIVPSVLWAAWHGWGRPLPYAAKRIAAMVLCYAAVVGAWGTYNKIHGGVWMFSTTSGGVGLWEGLGEVPNDYGFVLGDLQLGELLAKRGMNNFHAFEADSYLKSQYMDAVLHHPGFVARVILHRWDNILFRSEAFHPNYQRGLQRFLDKFGLILVAAAVALYWRNQVAILIATVPVLYALFSIGLVHWEPRYVRYVHLGYLAALLLVIEAIAARLPERGTVRYAAPFRQAVLVLGVLLALRDLPVLLNSNANARDAAAARASVTGGDAVAGPTLEALRWNAVTTRFGIPKVTMAGDKLHVVTTKVPTDYQAVTKVDTGGYRYMLVEYTLDIKSGGGGLAVISSDGTTGLAGQVVSGPGRHAEQMVVSLGKNAAVQLVLVNHNDAGASEFDLTDFKLRFGPRKKETN